MTHLLLRADATPHMGTGHVMRCLALSQAAQDEGLDVRFITRVQVPWVRERLRAECVPLVALDDAVPREESPTALLAQLAQVEAAPADTWVVLDGYHFTCACQSAVRQAGYRLLVIDDYAHLPEYNCDILLNQNPGAEDLTYAGAIGRKLLGPRYALLRREFREARERLPHTKRNVPPKNILVTLGGGDFIEHLGDIAQNMSIPAMKGRTVRVIQGAMDAERIKQAFANCPARLEILPRVTDMPTLLLETDLCITAGGSTCWELCCLEVPFLTVEVAENQHELVRIIEENGTAARFRASIWQTALHAMQLTAAAPTTVDGKGAHRALAECLTCLRDVTEADMEFLFQLVNRPSIRAVSFHTAPIPWEEHVRWFCERLRQKLPFFIMEYNRTPCGYIRFSGNAGSIEVSIALCPEARGKNAALVGLRQACRRIFAQAYADTEIHAFVKCANTTSMKFFECAGFTRLADSQSAARHVAHFTLFPASQRDEQPCLRP